MENAFIPKTRNQLAEAYAVSRKTLYRWLKELDIQERHMITKPCLELLYSKYGNPYKNKPKITAK